ncbi:MAG: VWA domain-containing protein [Actinomycetota bacterium]|nr:VWA domain-containing protein [Actinomycetota bacterium]
MGTGRFKNGKFDLTVVANFVMSAGDVTEWERGLKKASELFWDASEGQIQFGRIFVSDDSVGIDTAEMILHAAGDPSYGTWGLFGQPGQALHLMPYVKRQPLTVLHEMGHHVWALGEEYAGPAAFDRIDTSVAPANNSTIPLVGSTFAAGTLVGASVILKFGAVLERKTITANTTTSLTVASAFSQSPVNDDDGWVQYQFAAECATAANSRFCIMEKSRNAAGEFNAAGTWVPATNPVVEFCSDSNHDPDGDTQQEDRNSDSCWQTIAARTGYTGLTVPNPAAAGPATGFTVPSWIVLDKQPRFAVVFDRSGSMSAGNKMADAHHGATYWLEFCALADDLLTVVAYDHAIDVVVPLTQVSTLAPLTNEIAAIEALGPRGATDIRDALFSARSQIIGPPTRAAVQVALLLTDGIHNTPPGSSPTEVLPSFQDDGIRIYALGVGSPATVDMTPLNALATGTGGRSYAVGDNQPGQIEAAMVEINAEVRGGIITTSPVLFPDSRGSTLDKFLAPFVGERRKPLPPEKRPRLEEVLKAARVADIDRLRARRGRAAHPRLVAIPVDVEDGTARASFATTHPDTTDLWLYLVDPAGNVADPADPAVHHVASPAPHEFIVVDGPMPGRWYVVAVRIRPGAATTARFVAGGENPSLQVFGWATPAVQSGSPAMLHASARWLHQLTGLRITAEVHDPLGTTRTVVLTDNGVPRDGTGQFEAAIATTVDGRYTGLITVSHLGDAQIADASTLMLHSAKDELSAEVKVPPFVRQIPFSFEVGSPRDIKDEEDPQRWEIPEVRVHPKPDRKVVSAKLRRR